MSPSGHDLPPRRAIGALEAKLISLEDHWFCENGRYQVGPATIHDAEKIGETSE